LRAVEGMAAEHGLDHRVVVRGDHAVVNLWRGNGA
jgi:hypothetical protein